MRPISQRLVLAGVVLCALLFAASRRNTRVSPAFAQVPVTTEGAFKPNGQFPGPPPPHAVNVRVWGSWSGSDTNTGSITFGPFIATRSVTFALGGYPSQPGNSLELHLAGTGETRKFATGFDVGERWQYFDVVVPESWVGKPMTVTATDHATASCGWQGISEPVRGGRAEGVNALLSSLAAWCLNGGLLALIFWAAARELEARRIVAATWLPLVAAGVVGVLGLAAFWAYFAHPAFGKAFSFAVLGISAYFALRRRHRAGAVPSDIAAQVKLMLAIGFLYLSLFHLFPSSREFYNLASERFRESLPGDNTLPNNAALKLYNGDTLRWPGADWLSSDRPPLQTGWQLLTLPVLKPLHLDDTTVTGTSSVWLQLLWVPAAFGLLRVLGLSRDRATAWTVVLSLSGFFLQNTVFTWPKLSAAAFGVGAFVAWMLPGALSRSRANDSRIAKPPRASGIPDRPYAIGGMLAGLAWLSHGGIAFSFLVLVPWILWRVLRGELRGWLVAGTVFAAFALPWFCFQKLYDPPGDRLIKMHLAGQQEADPRSAWTVIREAYRTKTAHEVITAKVANFRMQTLGNWSGIVDFSPSSGWQRKNDEFFSSGRALTWWTLGAVLLPIGLAFPAVRARIAPVRHAHVMLLGWTLLTAVLWCLLMFQPYSAVIHQGSYAMMLGALVLLSAWLEAVSRWSIFIIGGLQLATFVTTWAWLNSHVAGALTGAPFLALAALALAALLLGALRRSCHET